MIILKYKNDIKSDLLYIFKKLYENNKITKDEYTSAVNKAIEKKY